MLRILLVTEGLGSGGAERQICGLASMLTRAGYPCRLIIYVENQFYESYLRQNNVDYEFAPELRNKITRVFRVAKYVRDYRADVIISYLPSVNMTMCLAKPLYRGKLIVSERNNNVCVTRRDLILFNLYRIANAIVPNSHSQEAFICRKFPFLTKKVHPIINFVDVNLFSPKMDSVSNNALKIIIVARYTYQKNALNFLKAVRCVKDMGLKVHFDWFGDKSHNASYYTQVESTYHELDIDDYISLHDSCQEIEKEYQKSDVLCLPSLYEGYPNVVAEAMSCGLPVICSNRYENPYIVENGVSGFLFNPEDVEDIVLAIKKITELSYEERIKMGERNRELCIERNSEDAFLKSYIELIEGLK